MSYLFGKFFGKNKVFLKISPNKTYEGFFGGIIITNIIFIFLFINLDISTFINSINYFILINLVIIFSFFGDFIESYLKRLNNLKDSSKYIPGHGGFFDRFDSFLLVIISFSIYKFLI